MVLFRVDNRLVHGQVIEAWLPFLHAKQLIVANDDLASDALRQQIICLAIPKQINVHFITIAQLPEIISYYPNEKILILLEHCQDLAQALKYDISISRINIGNLHFGANKKQLLPHVAVTDAEFEFLQSLNEQYMIDFRSIPTEKPRGLHEL